MACYLIPKNAGKFRIVKAFPRNYLVSNAGFGRGSIRINCKTKKQAVELCRILNEGRHNGEVRV